MWWPYLDDAVHLEEGDLQELGGLGGVAEAHVLTKSDRNKLKLKTKNEFEKNESQKFDTFYFSLVIW